MNGLKRPDPDELLRRLKKEKKREAPGRGRLKIFLGYSAGVGKTYQMLEEARILKNKGIDVVVGLVETHGRSETETLLEGFEIVPRSRKEYQGIFLEEMDLDAVESRRPAVLIVDELAHTNVPGSRHGKRFQDVEELLGMGIDVFSTLNIQHVESFKDVVYQVSGVRVRETVPDRVLTLADEIELVDLPPDALLQRFREGKVYIPAKAQQAMFRFFRKGNLLALRELVLRFTTQHAEKNLQAFMASEGVVGPLPAGSRILVCVSASPFSQKLIRVAQRFSADMDAEWFAVHVDLMQSGRPDERVRSQLAENLNLAEEFGGKVATLPGISAAVEVLKFAHSHNVSLLIVGYPGRPRWREFLFGSFVNDIVRRSGTMHVLVVGSQERQLPRRKILFSPGEYGRQSWFAGVVSVAVMTGICLVLRPYLEFVNVAMLLLLPVVFSSVLWQWSAGISASLLAVALLDFFFVPPFYTFAIGDLRYLPSFFVFFAVAVITGLLADMVKRQQGNAVKRERFVSALYSFSRDLMTARALDEILDKANRTISDAFQCEVVILLPDSSGSLKLASKSDEEILFSENDFGVATWVFQQGRPAGQGTETLSSAAWRFLPFKDQRGIFGVLGVHTRQPGQFLSPEKRLLDAFANIVALALART